MTIIHSTHRSILFFTLLLISTGFVQAQKKGKSAKVIKDYTQLTKYFEKQKNQVQQVYNDLTNRPILIINELIIFEDEVIAEIELNTSQDSSTSVWKDLQTAFKVNHHLDIEHWLFIKMANSFDIPFEDIRLRVYNKTKNGAIPNVDGRIIYDVNKELIAAEGFDYRTKVTGSLELEASQISSNFHFLDVSQFDDLTLEDMRNEFYEKIMKGANAHFINKDQDAVDIKRTSHKHILTFQVRNIQNEIVKKGSGLFAKYTTPYERIYFTLNVSLNEGDNSIFIAIDIDGKYGSAFSLLRPSEQGNYIDMYPDYKVDLDNYIKTEFINLLTEWLTK